MQSIHKQDHQRWRYDTVIHLEQSQKYPQDIPQISGLVWLKGLEQLGTLKPKCQSDGWMDWTGSLNHLTTNKHTCDNMNDNQKTIFCMERKMR